MSDVSGTPSRPAAGRADTAAVAVLVVVPLLVYAVPALAGHPVMPGDDHTQNFPLRVLVGRQLRAGHAPLYDPYIWSGAALLGGWNAGAMSPFTWLFAVLPATAAWVVAEAAVYAVAGVGAYRFCRALRLRPSAAFIGAASFALAGAEEVHLAHFGLVEGSAWIPLVLLALLRLDEGEGLAARARWVAVLGLAGGLVVLAGEPRAISTAGIVAACYLAWLLLRRPRRAPTLLLAAAAGGALAAALSAVQWVPGAEALATSQRAGQGYALFTAGSLSPPLLSLLLVPVTLGGSGSLGTPSWFASYNLPEVMGYVGLVPAASVPGLLATLRRRRPRPPWTVWVVVAVVGAVLALGGFTPLAHVLVHVPLFGGQRLQSRNIAVTDVALAVLAAYWADAAVAGRIGPWARAAALAPVVAAAALAGVALAEPTAVAEALGATAGQAVAAPAVRPLLAVWVGLAVVVGAALVVLPRLPVRARAGLLVAVVVVDVTAFELACNWTVPASTPPAPNAGSPIWASGPVRPIPGLGRTGRFAIYDPDLFAEPGLIELGQPDRNILVDTYSSLGYTAIVDGTYAAATGGHLAQGGGTNSLDPAALRSGVFDRLATTTLLTVPEYLLTAVRAGAAPGPPGPSTDPGPGDRSLGPGAGGAWPLGQTVTVSGLAVRATGAAAVRLGLQRPDGQVVWSPPAAPVDGVVSVTTPPTAAVAVEAETAGRTRLGPPVVRAGRVTYRADGVLEGALDDPAHWAFAGDDGGVAVFTNRRAVPVLTLAAAGPAGTAGASVRRVAGDVLDPSAAAVDSPAGVTVVRAVAAIPGWTATWQPDGGRPHVVAVRRRGPVQAVTVPAGPGVVRWTYRAPGWPTGRVVSEVGLAALVALLVAGQSRRRADRRERRRADEPSAAV